MPDDSSPGNFYASWINNQVTDLPLCGGIRLPLAIGAVVLGRSWDFQTPLRGQI